MGVVNYENSYRRICEADRSINSSDKGMGEKRYDPSDPIAVRSAIIQRAELERSCRSELDISERYGYIYLTTNIINGKMYIGQHRSEKLDVKYYGSGKLLSIALKKYGKDNFDIVILEWCSSLEDMNMRETFWINEFKCVDSDIFYNICEGGGAYGTYRRNAECRRKISEALKRRYEENPELKRRLSEAGKSYFRIHENPFKGKSHSEEVKTILRDKAIGRVSPMKGRKHTDKAKRLISEKNTGRSHIGYWSGKRQPEEANIKRRDKMLGDKNHFYGKHHSDETKRMISEKNRGKSLSEETKRKISDGCKGHVQPESQKLKNRIKMGKRIECIETGMVFLSYTEAAEWLGKSDGAAIRNSARQYDEGVSAMRYGYHWRWHSDDK